MTRIAIILGSTRPGRKGGDVARWVHEHASRRDDAEAAGFVGYGSAGGVRAVEHLRGVMAEMQIADVRAQAMLSRTARDGDGIWAWDTGRRALPCFAGPGGRWGSDSNEVPRSAPRSSYVS